MTLVAIQIQNEYPNNYLDQKREILYCVIDSKDFIEHMKGNQ